MVVNPSFPAKSLPEFITYAKANSAKMSVASGGVGGPDHLSGELFKVMAGVNMIHVPYRGLAPALTDLLGEQVQVVFSTVPAAIEYIKAGQATRAWSDDRDALRIVAGRSDRRRDCARLRG